MLAKFSAFPEKVQRVIETPALISEFFVANLSSKCIDLHKFATEFLDNNPPPFFSKIYPIWWARASLN